MKGAKMVELKNPAWRKRQKQLVEKIEKSIAEIAEARAQALTEEDRRRMQLAQAALEEMKSNDEREFAAVAMPQGSQALEAPIDPNAPFHRRDFIERLDLHYRGWREGIPEFPDLDAAALIELAEFCEQIVDELQDHHTHETLHSVFVSLDNQAGTASQLLTENSYLAVLALVNALELFTEDDADHSALIMKYQKIAVSCLDIQASIMRDRAAAKAAGAAEDKGE